MAAHAMEIAQLSSYDGHTFITTKTNGTVTDAMLGICAFWKFTDNYTTDHSLKIEVEVNYCKRSSYYGSLIADNLTQKTSVEVKFKNRDNNNSTDTAEMIDPFIWYEWRYLSWTDREDFYKIWVKQNQRLYVMMCPPSELEFNADFDLYLIDKDNVIQGSSTNRGDGIVEEASVVSTYEGYWYIKIVQINDHGYYRMTASVENTGGGGGGCPILSVFNGFAFAVEGLLDIHNPNYTDVVREHVLDTEPQPVNYTYLLRLTEHPQTHSHIDQVKLYAKLENNVTIRLPLLSAVHSEQGNVLPQLLFSDDVRADTQARQTITFKFLALPPWMNVEAFIFTIEGHNPNYKT